MIQIPAILREMASSGGSLYEKGPPSIAVLHIYEVMTNFTRVYFGYEYPHSINTFASDISEEIKKACLYNQEVMRITKVHVSVLLRNDHKAQDIIAHIFCKIQDKLQKYLVFIDFFNKEMYNKCNVE